MLHLHVAQHVDSCETVNLLTTAITLSLYAPVSYPLPITIEAELNIKFPLSIDLNKILPDLLK